MTPWQILLRILLSVVLPGAVFTATMNLTMLLEGEIPAALLGTQIQTVLLGMFIIVECVVGSIAFVGMFYSVWLYFVHGTKGMSDAASMSAMGSFWD
jgi:hypothetical protein